MLQQFVKELAICRERRIAPAPLAHQTLTSSLLGYGW